MSKDSINNIKERIRKRILTKLRNQKREDGLKKSLMILKKLFALPEFQKAKTVLFYASFDGEVDTLEMMERTLKSGKKIALPSIYTKDKSITPVYVHNLKEDLVLGPYGIHESRLKEQHPASLDDIDLAVVPGVAFDKDGFRLGRGAGYYDRFLVRLSHEVPAIGLAFDFQIVSRLPRHGHDVPMARVLSA